MRTVQVMVTGMNQVTPMNKTTKPHSPLCWFLCLLLLWPHATAGAVDAAASAAACSSRVAAAQLESESIYRRALPAGFGAGLKGDDGPAAWLVVWGGPSGHPPHMCVWSMGTAHAASERGIVLVCLPDGAIYFGLGWAVRAISRTPPPAARPGGGCPPLLLGSAGQFDFRTTAARFSHEF